MEVIYGAIHGAYAYLLIFQILVVTLLFLTLIWLIVKRTREGALYASGDRGESFAPAPRSSTINADSQAPVAAYASAAPAPVAAAATELSSPAPGAGGDPENMAKVEDEKRALAEKVKFLESKLLEYEILQEEIGALGALKVENEKLKERLVGLERGTAAPGTILPAAEAKEPGQSPKELAQQLASAFDTNVVFTGDAPAPQTQPPQAEAKVEEVPAKKQTNLDDLLSQIDSLTSGDR